MIFFYYLLPIDLLNAHNFKTIYSASANICHSCTLNECLLYYYEFKVIRCLLIVLSCSCFVNKSLSADFGIRNGAIFWIRFYCYEILNNF